MARRHYEEADAERRCKEADAEARGSRAGRRAMLVQEEGVASEREKVEKLGCHGF